MDNIGLCNEMLEYFVDNIEIETRMDDVCRSMYTMFGRGYMVSGGHSYIRGVLTYSEGEDVIMSSGDTMMDGWASMFMWTSLESQTKFDIGEFKGCLPIKSDMEYDMYTNRRVMRMEFSIDFIDQNSDRQNLPFELGSLGSNCEYKKSHFEEDLFEL